MAEAYFYHLEHRTLEQVLPRLLELTLARGWRAIVQAGSEERVDALDNLLWTYDPSSFLPHGTRRDGHPELQAIYLTSGEDNPTGAQVRFLVDGADTVDFDAYTRVVYVFDGRDETATARARDQWKTAKAAGATLAYWQQGPEGNWIKRG